MSGLLEAIRRIGNDLIAKRLWPVALALLAAIALVPMLLGGSSSEPAAPAPVATAPPAASDPAAAAAADDGAAPARRPARHPRASGGKVRDPFYDPADQPAAASATAGTDPGGGATSAVADPATPSSPVAAGKGATSAKKPAEAKPAAPARSTPKPTPAPTTSPVPTRSKVVPRPSYYRAVVRWGSSRHAAPYPIARLTPLGGRHNPAALYLGVTKPGLTYAIFVLGTNAVSHGDGECRAETQCRMIALRPGDTRRFTVRSPADGTVRRFTLRLSSLKSVATTASAARRGRTRVHPDGREVLHAMWSMPGLAEVLAWATYDRSSGLLRPAADRDDVEKPPR